MCFKEIDLVIIEFIIQWFIFSGHRLEFIIGDHVLPYDMTVYQAVQQFGSAPMFEPAEADPENRNSTGSGASGAAVMYGSPGNDSY